MSNAYTDTSSGSLGNYLVQTAYDRYVEFALRAVPLVRDVADKRPVQQAMPGSSVVFQIYTDLSPATTALSETSDPDAVAIGNTTPITVTLQEYGNASLATRKLELFSLSDVDPAIADIIAFNMADSLDTVALATLVGGPNAIATVNGSLVTTYAGTYTNGTTQKSILGTDYIKVLLSCVPTRLFHVKANTTGVVSTQKFHTTCVQKQAQTLGAMTTSTQRQVLLSSGQEQSEPTKVQCS